MNSGLPPRSTSVPRPAMLVEMVTAPLRPAWATISASRMWYLALSTVCTMPFCLSMCDSTSDFSTEMVRHAEQVLKRDRREGLVLLLDGHVLFGFDSLVQAIGPAPSRHLAAGVLVDDEDLALLDQIVDVALVERVRAQRLGNMVQPV